MQRLRRLFRRRSKVDKNAAMRLGGDPVPGVSRGDAEDKRLNKQLDKNEQALRRTFQHADDVVFRSFTVQKDGRLVDGLLVYIDGMINSEAISEQILERILVGNKKSGTRDLGRAIQLPDVSNISVGEVDRAETYGDVLDAIVAGQTAIFVDGESTALTAETRGWEKRGLEEPTSEPSVRGIREGFTETLLVNTAILRRRIKDPALKVRTLTLGQRTQTTVAVMYVEGLVNPGIRDEVLRRLQAIDTGAVLDSTIILEYLSDRRPSLFPLIATTERPDRCYHAILEGGITILVDGSPFPLIAPSVFTDFQSSVDDYYDNVFMVAFLRGLRVLSQGVSIVLPALYVALVSFHPEFIPTRLALTIAGTRQGIPFPAEIEVFIILLGTEVLLESSVRLPRAIGQTVGIVGGIILGDAIVSAGIVSSVMIIIIAFTLITSFTLPSFQLLPAVRLLRYVCLFASVAFGLFGLTLAVLVILTHLLTLESFGVPYMSPYAPMRLRSLGANGGMFRLPHWAAPFRPEQFRPLDEQRQKKGVREQQSPDLVARKRDVTVGMPGEEGHADGAGDGWGPAPDDT